MNLYYIGLYNNQKIFIPFTPGTIRSKMDDEYYIINDIFGDTLTDNYLHIYEAIAKAIHEGYPEYWEEAGELLLSLHTGETDRWGNHFIKVAHKMRSEKHKKYLKVIPYYTSEDSGRRFRRLLKGELPNADVQLSLRELQ